jgi:hypothetical protein
METDCAPRTTVAVRPGAAIHSRPRLFAALEAAFPVSFTATDGGDSAAAGAIEVGDEPTPPDRNGAPASAPTLIVGNTRSDRPPTTVRFAEQGSLDRRIRGISVSDSVDALTPTATADEEILASSPAGPAWTRSRGDNPIYRLSASLPELKPEQSLLDLLSKRSLTLVALVQFLRSLTTDDFEPPELRAAILFDDPNLRWRTYGFIDFRQLADHADAHNYHASMAMIPLDGWHQHRATVDLFRRRRERLSLVLHGNNHLARELMRPPGDSGAIAIAAQALRRATRFEAHYGLRMDRLMTPPHGMCSASTASALGSLGFDALCAIHPLPWTEQPPADRPLAGWDPAEFAAGCAVIPRVHLSTPFEQIALRAFLGHPLILYGHHDDLACGLDLLADTAARVNRLGDVRWASLGEIAASNYAAKLESNRLRVRPYSHRLRFDLPPGIDSLVLEPPRGLDGELAGWSVDGAASRPFGSLAPCGPGSVEVRLQSSHRIDPLTVPAPAASVWPILRRTATETRDRLRPLIQAGSA